MGLMDWFKEASGFDFEYPSNIGKKILIIFLYQPHSHMYVQ
jgi:hypothetical protein